MGFLDFFSRTPKALRKELREVDSYLKSGEFAAEQAVKATRNMDDLQKRRNLNLNKGLGTKGTERTFFVDEETPKRLAQTFQSLVPDRLVGIDNDLMESARTVVTSLNEASKQSGILTKAISEQASLGDRFARLVHEKGEREFLLAQFERKRLGFDKRTRDWKQLKGIVNDEITAEKDIIRITGLIQDALIRMEKLTNAEGPIAQSVEQSLMELEIVAAHLHSMTHVVDNEIGFLKDLRDTEVDKISPEIRTLRVSEKAEADKIEEFIENVRRAS